ncbi:unnamed protein product, partial [Mesorhabditis spiculigera]
MLFVSTRHRSFYEVLGVPKDATQKEIKQAFYEKSKKLHPDGVHVSDDERLKATKDFVELKTAYDTLRRPADRRAYDAGPRRYDRRRPIYPSSSSGDPGGSYYDHYNGSWSSSGPFDQKRPDFRTHSDEQWRWVFRTTAIGLTIVMLYNLGYVYQIYQEERRIARLIDKDEIAKSFLRQKGFEDMREDRQEMLNLAQLLKDDVDEAWRRRCEEMKGKNRDEIREEYRWFRAVQDPNNTRRTRPRRPAEDVPQPPPDSFSS